MRFILFVPVVLSLSACGGGSHSRDDDDAGTDAGPMDDAGPDTGPMELDAGMLAPVGAACAFAGDCQGDFCINEGIAPGFVDGYCTGTCDLDADPVEACVMHGGD